MTLVLGYGQQVAFQIDVIDVASGDPVGTWAGMVPGEMPVGARWSKPAGSAGTFVFDNIEAWWSASGE
jgi:predicted secreted protein